MEKISRSRLVYITVDRIISSLENTLDRSSTKAILSDLRNSAGRSVEDNIKGLKLIYQYMPEEFYTRYDNLSYEELAILTTLQLYAIHQQSNSSSANSKESTGTWDNLGGALSWLRREDSSAVDRRFNALITSETVDELSVHLRQMIKLLKSKTENVKINYPKLARDLYNFIRGYDQGVRLNWTRGYYSMRKEGEENEE